MKIGEIKNFETKTIGDIDTIQAKIADDSMPFLFEMMSKSLYSNPIGSIVREITSNCFDSHKEAGVDDAVVIKKEKDDEGDFISFNDFGVGLSPERIRNVYMNYFSSTKRDSNEQIGGFGLGSKTPLSYVDMFYITTNFNSKKYQYILSKGESSPTLDLLDESNTTERNGTEIKIYISSDKDITRFENELKTQLCYFDNVYFVGWNIDNDYRIYDLKHFKYRSQDQYSDEAHIILGKVSYPISWEQLEIKQLKVPIGIKFEIGEILITPNREQLRYTDEIKTLVKERIELARNECIELFESQNKVFDNYFEWYQSKNIKPSITFEYRTGDGELDVAYDKLFLTGVDGILKRNKCSIFDGIEYLEIDNLLSKLYTSIGSFYNKKVSKDRGYSLQVDSSTNSTYIGEGSTVREDFAFTHNSGICYRRKDLERNTIKYHDYNIFKDIVNKKKYKKLETDANGNISSENKLKYEYFNLGIGLRLYKAIKTIRQQVEEHFRKYEEITDEQKKEFKKWKDENNANLQRRLNGKVLVKDMTTNYVNNYDWMIRDTFEGSGKNRIYKHGIDSYKGLIIYGFRDDTRKLKKAVTALGQFKTLVEGISNDWNKINSKACKVLQISQQNEKYFIDKPNMIHVDNLYSDNKLFRKLASSIKIEEYFIEIGSHRAGNGDDFIKQIKSLHTGTGEKLETLKKYYENTRNKEKICGSSIERRDLKQEILQIAKQNNLFDPIIEGVFTQLDEWFKGVEIIKYTDITEASLPLIVKLLVNNKKKLNCDWYQKFVVEHDFDNLEPYTIKDSDGNRIGKQQVLEFEPIKEEVQETKLKIIFKNVA